MRANKVAVLFSGGKDSTYVIEKLRSSGYEVSCLVSLISENPDSYMLHTPNIELARLSAEALEIPIEFGFTKGLKEQELIDIRNSLKEARKKFSFDYLGSGGLSSEYQRSRLQRILKSSDSPPSPHCGVLIRKNTSESCLRRNSISS